MKRIVRKWLSTVILLTAVGLGWGSAYGQMLYVDAGRTGGTADGSSWANAFRGEAGLAEALEVARAANSDGDGGNNIMEIWVAGGMYKPQVIPFGMTNGVDNPSDGLPEPVALSDRDKAFALLPGVAIYGGFSGSESSLGGRDVNLIHSTNKTILSGDLDNSGGLSNSDAYHVVVSVQSEGAIMDGLTIQGGNSTSENTADYTTFNSQAVRRDVGGGWSNFNSSVTVNNCVFTDNYAHFGGGGANSFSNIANKSPTIINCIFQGNVAATFGGGGFRVNGPPSNPQISDSKFVNNIGCSGGGILNQGATINLIGVEVIDNTANGIISVMPGYDPGSGGGIYNAGTMVITGSQLIGNECIVTGGGVFSAVNIDINSTLIQTNKAAQGGGFAASGLVDIDQSRIIENETGGIGAGILAGGGSTINVRNTVIAKNKVISGAGSGVYNNGSTLLNIANTTIYGNTVESGDWGGVAHASGTTVIRNSILWGNAGTETNATDIQYSIVDGAGVLSGTGNSNSDPKFVDVSTNNFNLMPGSPAINKGDNTQYTGTENDFDVAGNTRIQQTTIDIGAYESPYSTVQPDADKRLYVKKNGAGVMNGSDWDNALPEVADALAAARTLNAETSGTVSQIWVAKGTYYPTEKVESADDRSKTFQLVNNVSIYGGFEGNETSGYNLALRDLETNETILSGDLDGVAGTQDAYHVFYHPEGLNLDASAVLDGFTIEGGRADHHDESSIHRNGGGMHNRNASPTIKNVKFRQNVASYWGGAIYNINASNPTLDGIIVESNEAQNQGGGGIVSTGASNLTIVNSIIAGNMAKSNGGGIYHVSNGSLTLKNVQVSGNTAASGGAGIYSDGSVVINMLHTTIAGNYINSGGAAGIQGWNSAGVITNSIIAGNYKQTTEANVSIGSAPGGSGANVTNSLIKTGGLEGATNISTDPFFVELVLPTAADAPTTAGDYHLMPYSQAIDAGNDDLLLSYPELNVDLEGKSRPHTGNPISGIDMGAYESPFFKLQDLINATNDGETLTLTETSYQISIPLYIPGGRSITIEGLATGTTIEQKGTGRVLTVGVDNENNNVVTLKNITISGGNVSAAASAGGGGIRVNEGSTLTLINSQVVDNVVIASGNDARGGGIYNDNANVSLVNSIVAGNSITGTGNDSQGGGIYSNAGLLTIIDSKITDNGSANHGGGIFINGGTAFNRIINTEIIGNTARSNTNSARGEGAGIHVLHGKVLIFDGKIADNTMLAFTGDGTPTLLGGGLRFQGSTSEGIIRKVVFSGNSANGGAATNQHVSVEGQVDLNGNYWEDNTPTNLTGLIACADAGCTTDLTLKFLGTGSGKVMLSHAAGSDAGYKAIFDMLDEIEYGGSDDHFGDMIGTLEATGEHTWTLPTGIKVDLDRAETTLGTFGGWTGEGTGSDDKRSVTVSNTALEVTASFWSSATALAFSGDNDATAGEIVGPITIAVLDEEENPTRLTEATTFTLSSTGTAKFYSDASGTNEITMPITINPGTDISEVTPNYTFYYSNTIAADPQTITAEFITGDESLEDGEWSYNIAMNPGTATKLLVLMPGETHEPGTADGKGGTPNSLTAGAQATVTVYAIDEYWNIVPAANNQVFISSTDGNAVLPESLTLSSGVGTFDITFKTSGSQGAIVETFGDLLQPSSGSTTVIAGLASRLSFGVQPSNTTAGEAISPAVTVRVEDEYGNLVTTSTENIVVGLGNSGSAMLSGDDTNQAINGVASFNDLSVDLTGTYHLTAQSISFDATLSNDFIIIAGAASKLSIGTEPVAGINGAAFGTQPVIHIVDAQGNVVTADNSTEVTVAIGDGDRGTLGGTLTATAVEGIATFAGVTLSGTVGETYTLNFTATGLTGAESGDVVLTGAGAATQLSITTQPAGGASGDVLTVQPVIEIRDAEGNVVTDDDATVVAVAIGDGDGGTLGGTLTATAVDGVATFAGVTLSGTVGETYTLNFTATGLTAVESGDVVLTGAGAATQLSITTQPAGGASGDVLTVQPVIEIRDAEGNVVTGDDATVVTVAIGDGDGGTLDGTLTATAVDGVATFAGVTLSGTVGETYTLNFTATGLTAVESGGVVLTGAGAATQLSITTQPAGGASGDALTTQPVIEIRDAEGNVVTADNSTEATVAIGDGEGGTLGGTLTATAVDGIATFAGVTLSGTVGETYTLNFTATGLTGAESGDVVLTGAGAATQLSITTQPAAGTSGAALTAQPVIEIRDAQGNVVTDDDATVVTVAVLDGDGGTLGGTLTATAVDGVAAFAGVTLSGTVGETYTLNFTATGLAGAESGDVVITGAGAATQLVITTHPVAGASGEVFTTQPVLEIHDAYGNVVTADNSTEVTVTITHGDGGTLTGSTTLTASSGIITFTDIELSGAVDETYVLNFTANPALATTEWKVFVTGHGVATQLELVGSAADFASGSTRQYSAILKDKAGNIVTTGAQSVLQITFAQQSGLGSVAGLSVATADEGIAQLILTGEKAGEVVLIANTITPALESNTLTVTVTVDKSALQTAIADAGELTETDYSPASWEAVQDALEAAQTVYDNANATQSEIDNAEQALRDALTGLTVDKSALQTAIADAGELTETDYSPASWEAVQDALEAAQTVYDNANATQSEIDNAEQALRDALTGLTVDKSALQTAIADAGELKETDYSSASWEAVQDALEAAQTIFDNPIATQSEIDAVTQALRDDAMTGLTVDRTTLQNSVEEGKELNEANYTPESWKDLQKALEAAQVVLDNPDAVQSEIDNALEQLNNALTGLSTGNKLGAPANAEAEAGDQQVDLTWTAPQNVSGAPIMDYLIQYTTDKGTTWHTVKDGTSTAINATITGLTNNLPYHFRVAAVNAAGTGAFSAATAITVPSAPVPDQTGELPEPAPGKTVVIVDGKPQAVSLEVIENSYLRLSNDSFTMDLASIGINNQLIPITDIEAVIRIIRGEGASVQVKGYGFEPGTVITLYVFSEPQMLGHIPVQENGTFDGTLAIPADLELGRHTLQANGVVRNTKEERSVSVGVLVVEELTQQITFNALPEKTYGDDIIALNATASSGLPVSYHITDIQGNDTDIAEIVDGNRLRINEAGTVQVIASQSGGGFYGAAQEASRKLVIKPATLSVSVKDSERPYGEENPVFEVQYSGFLNGDTQSALDKAPVATATATSTTGVGEYSITISGGESQNYTFDYTHAVLTVLRAYQEIQFPHVAEVERNAGTIPLDVSSSSGLPVVLSLDDEQVAALNGSSLDILRVGTVTVTATQEGDVNYYPAEPVSVTIHVTDGSDFPVRVHKAVSPNGDGINEFLMIEGIRDYPENRVTIINKNGTVLYEVTGYDNTNRVFRGISTGQLQLPAGTYFYIVEIKDNGRIRAQKGYFVMRY